ncbi:bifunctional DNA primase/polymerase [Bradyrhizobium denitrificans]|nr:bifunctional DNA primase/polymerase [Bradyrhizobium denitrificans]MCL8489212.1 bifunctional DNA primase/polymerase [Bradyrhizobium denitrificans]
MDSAFATAAPALIVGGYSPLPIAPAGDNAWSPKGKEPGLELRSGGNAEWIRMRSWQIFCARQPHAKTIAVWSKYPDAGVGVACGFGGLVAVDIDDEALVEPLLAVLPRVLVAKRGRKGLTAFFRATETLPSKNYRSTDKRGLLDFLSGGKQTVLPPTKHPVTGRPYEWTTERTLLDTPIAELPALTSAHHAALEDVLAVYGWSPPEGPESRSDTFQNVRSPQDRAPYDGAFLSAVRIARAQWLRELKLENLHRQKSGWRSVASFRSSGSTKKKLPGLRGLNLAIYDNGPIKDWATGQGYNDISLVAECLFEGNKSKAIAWLRDAIGWQDERTAAAPCPSPVRQPTYPDRRVSLVEAVDATKQGVDTFFNEILPEAEAERATYLARLEAARAGQGRYPLFPPSAPVTVLAPETGIGKSTAIEMPVVEQARRHGRSIVIAVQTIKLAEERAAALRARGLRVEIYRGYEKEDPQDPSHSMCRNIDAYHAARELGGNIRASICERLVDGKLVLCPFSRECGRERQRAAKPDVWVVTSALLMLDRPDFIPEPDALVIDEAFHSHCLGEQIKVRVKDLLTAKIEGLTDAERSFLAPHREALHAAIKDNGAGPLSCSVLRAQGITANSAFRAAGLEGRRFRAKLLRPDMAEAERRTVVGRHGAAQAVARGLEALWQEVATFLAEGDTGLHGDRARSSRVVAEGSTVTVKPLRPVHSSWRVPTLYLDATAAPADFLNILFGENRVGAPVVATPAHIVAHWSPHMTVRQIVGAPVAMHKVGLSGEAKPRNVAEIIRYIQWRAALEAPGRVGLITYAGLLEQIQRQLPANVITAHFGAVAGLNSMQNVDGMIVIGRPYVVPEAVESVASVVAGHPIDPIGAFFNTRDGGIRMADGTVYARRVDEHPHPFAEAYRWLVTEANLLQAIGRIRPHRRARPAWLDIVCDVSLPITVDECIEWRAPGGEAFMAAEGLVLSNRRDAAAVFALSDWGARGWVGFSSIESIEEKPTQPRRLRKVRYRKAGPGMKPNEGV